MATLVVTQHGVVRRKQRDNGIPHVQIGAECVAQHDDRTLAGAENVQVVHGFKSIGLVQQMRGALRRGHALQTPVRES